MRHPFSTFLVVSLLVLGGCGKRASSHEAPGFAAAPAASAAGQPSQGSQVQRLDRKIIRTAEMTVEVASPAQAEQKATALAETLGGYVVSSDVRALGPDDGSEEQSVTATLVLRVPAERFGAALEGLRALGGRVPHEKVSGQDVTEEYLDAEARVRSQRALEAQFLEIMKDAKTVKDALEVQQKLAEVRGEIERAEGRRRFLENQTSLSTITLTLVRNAPLVSASGYGFGDSVRRAGGDVVNVGAGIITGAIRLAGVLLPIGLLIVLPAWLLLRALMRRQRRRAPQA